MRAFPIALALLMLAGCQEQKREKPPANESTPAAQAGPVKGVDRSHRGKPVPDIEFNNPDGGEISLADFNGSPVLINLWATWCAPCIKELPTLDRLARSHDVDGELGVIAVSQDSGTRTSVEAFLNKLRIKDLGAYQDSKMALSGGLGTEVLPTSILIDAQGREVWRYVGDLDWSSPAAARLLAEARPAAKG